MALGLPHHGPVRRRFAVRARRLGPYTPGVINPASKNKRSYFIDGDQSGEPQHWLETTEEKKGSWWNHWFAWLKPRVGKDVPARRKLGSNAYPVIESAPGRYVKIKAQ